MAYFVENKENRCPTYDTFGNPCSHGCCWGRSDNSYCCSWAESVGDLVLVLIGAGSSLFIVIILVSIVCCCVKSKSQPGQIITSPGQSCPGTASGSQIGSRNDTMNVIPEHRTHNYRPCINSNSRSAPWENITSQSELNEITQNVAGGANSTVSIPHSNRSTNLPTISENTNDTVISAAYNTINLPQRTEIIEPPPSYDSLFKG